MKNIFHAIDLKNSDATIRPQDDFFEYANGTWLKKTKIPKSESRWSAFDELLKKNQNQLYSILKEIQKKKDVRIGSHEQIIRDFLVSGMNVKRRNRDKLRTLSQKQEAIKVFEKKDLPEFIAQSHIYGIQSLWDVYVEQDEKDTKKYILSMTQSGLGLPNRDYYDKKDKKSVIIQSRYRKHIAKIFMLAGEKKAAAEEKAAIIWRLESCLAKKSDTEVQLRDSERQYNKMTLKQVQILTPSIDWKSYFLHMGIKNIKKVIIRQPQFMKSLNDFIQQSKTEDLKTYHTWKLLSSTVGKLSKEFIDEQFDFYGKTLSGMEKKRPQWKNIVSVIDEVLGDALGQIYVKKYFSKNAKIKMNDLVQNLKEAFKNRLKNLDWMTDTTKKKALKKLENITDKIGYPEKWKSYEGLVISSTKSYIENYWTAHKLAFTRMINKLEKPVDNREWFTTAQTVNAYFHPLQNTIVFPAGILQFPFFDERSDDAVNYGAIGAVIGHELTHGFDDQGRKYDYRGIMKNWWTEVDREKFEMRTQKLVQQANSFKVLQDQTLNGMLTLGENIADLGGLAIAFDAFMLALKKQVKTELIDGFTQEQRFFLSWAQIWRNKNRDEYARKLLLTDPHASSKFRVNGPFMNLESFHKAWNTKEKDKMYRSKKDQIKIW